MSDSLTRPEPGERPRRYRRGNALADTLAASFGLGMYDLFRLAGGERQKILVKSAERFQRSVDVPGWKPVLSMPIELGGSVENDLMLFAYVQLTDAAEWRELLGEATSISVDAWRMRAGFVSRRVFDPGISNAHDAPVVRFEEELVIMVHSTEPKSDWSMLLAGEQGVREVLSGTIRPNEPRYVFDPQERIAAFPGHLVAWDDSDQPVYLPIRDTHELDVGTQDGWKPLSSFLSGRYERLDLGSPDTQVPDPDVSPPDALGSDAPELFGIIAHPLGRGSVFRPPDGGGGGYRPPTTGGGRTSGGGGYRAGTAGTVAGATSVEEEVYTDGSGNNVGYGPNIGTSPGFEACSHYDARDSCRGCCITIGTAMGSSIAGAAIACHFASDAVVCAHVACGVAEAVAAGLCIWYTSECDKNCLRKVRW